MIDSNKEYRKAKIEYLRKQILLLQMIDFNVPLGVGTILHKGYQEQVFGECNDLLDELQDWERMHGTCPKWIKDATKDICGYALNPSYDSAAALQIQSYIWAHFLDAVPEVPHE